MALARYSLKDLSNEDLVSELKKLVGRDQQLTAELLAHLSEVDSRRLYLNEATPSLFEYCTTVLHFSEDVAYKRIQACRTARAYPKIFEMVARGELHLSALTLLGPRLTQENHRELLEAVRHKSKRAVEEFLAARFARPDVATSLRKLPDRPAVAPLLLASSAVPAMPPALPPGGELPSVAATAASTACSGIAAPQLAPSTTHTSLTHSHAARDRAELSPLSRDRYQLKVTLSAETRAKLLRARDLLRHKQPDGDLGVVLDEALGRLCDELERQKFGKRKTRAHGHIEAQEPGGLAPGQAAPGQKAKTERDATPAAVHQSSRPSSSRHIPRAVRRAVAERDEYQCSFVAADGRRCSARSMLEFHHITPYAKGGAATVDNTTLRCRGHNGHAAVLDFGVEAVQAGIVASTLRRRATTTSPPPP